MTPRRDITWRDVALIGISAAVVISCIIGAAIVLR